MDKIRTRFESLDDRFAGTDGDQWTLRIFDDGRWTEGPAYFPAGRYLVFSDIPNDRVLRWDETTGSVGVFRQPSSYANGHFVDRRGRLITCEQGARRVSRTEPDGSRTVLADKVDGKPLNSPNDVVEHSDGSIWFTDPSYGIDSDYEGTEAASELDGCHVYRIAGDGGIRQVTHDVDRPNGLAFSADEGTLYVSDSRRKHIRRFAVGDGGVLSGGETFAECQAGTFDGLRLDAKGRIWAATHEGLHCYAPDGSLIGKLHIPEITSNLTFGGLRRNFLFITASSSVYVLKVNVTGVAYPMDRSTS